MLSDPPSCSDKSEDTEVDQSNNDELKPLFINQELLNDLDWDLYFSKEKAESLGSKLQQWNLLEGTIIFSFHECNKHLSSYYATADDIKYCTKVNYCKDDISYRTNVNELKNNFDVNIILFTGDYSLISAKQA